MSVSIADYQVLRPHSQSAKVFDIPSKVVDDDADEREKMILAFIANPSGDADLEYDIEIRQVWLPDAPPRGTDIGWLTTLEGADYDITPIYHAGFATGSVRGIWVPFSGSRLAKRRRDSPIQIPASASATYSTPGIEPGEEHPSHDGGWFSQQIWFVPNGEGSVRFHNVVFWYQRRLAEAARYIARGA